MLTARPNGEFTLSKKNQSPYAPPVEIKFNPAQAWDARKRRGNWYLTNKRSGAKIRIPDTTFKQRFDVRVNDNALGALRIAALAMIAAFIIGACIAEKRDAPAEIAPQETLQPATVSVTEPEAPVAADTPTLITLSEPAKTEPTEEWLNLGIFELTAYCPCEKCCGYWATVRPLDDNGNPIVYTSTGAVAQAGTTIAVDPSVIPYGTTVKINDHIYIAQDTGGAIRGNHVDIYYTDHEAALEHGRQQAEVYVLTNP